MGTMIDTSGLDDVQARLAELRKLRIQVGILREAGPHVVQGPQTTGLTVAQVGAFHEFGLGVPERSFLRRTFAKRSRDVAAAMARATKRVIDGDDPKRALGVEAEVMAGWVKSAIRAQIPPALAPSTIRQKTVGGKQGFIPLVDTGQLIQSIIGRVK